MGGVARFGVVATVVAVALAVAAALASAPRKPVPALPEPAASAEAAEAPAPAADPAARIFRDAVARGLPSEGVLLVVSVSNQTLTVVREGAAIATVPVSTSRSGAGNREGSSQTPLGWHRVCDRIGEGHPLGRVFIGRAPTDRVCPESRWSASSREDLVLTRILRLEGLEDGLNRGPGVNSARRCIYIHGTNEEQLLGQPASHGCIRMSNRRVAALFGLVKDRETWCEITL